MDDLTPRQIQILKGVIEEYIDTAEPVGSDILEKKHSVGVSPATIRNEMVALTQKGFLRQPHTSSGRVPSPKALKLYVHQLMDEKKLSVAEEVATKEQVMQAKDDINRVMQEVTRGLASQTHSLAVAATSDGDVWHAGYANILDIPEFYNIDVTSRVLSLLDETRMLHELFFERVSWDEPVEVVFGEEIGWPHFEPVGVVACQCPTSRGLTTIGVIGPIRFNYPSVIPIVRYFGELVSQI